MDIGCPPAGNAGEESLEVLVQQRMTLNAASEERKSLRVRELAINKKIGDLQERTVGSQLFDRIAAVTQDADVAVDIGDFRFTGRSVGKTRVECDVTG